MGKNHSLQSNSAQSRSVRTNTVAQAPAFAGQIRVSQHQGPLPAPEQLEAYNQLIPNGAERIMAMAEKQLQHRIEIEKIVVSSQQIQSSRGQIFGLAIGVLGIISGTVLAMFGHEVVGSIIAGSTVVTLVSVFVIGRRGQQRQLDSNMRAITSDKDSAN